MSRTFRKPTKMNKGIKKVRDGTPTRASHSCENNGGCPYCENNRLHSSRKRMEEYDIRDDYEPSDIGDKE